TINLTPHAITLLSELPVLVDDNYLGRLTTTMLAG
ncbi:MAG: hypothetical protein RL032_2014, partial [Pseudomonadota bacterium]